MTLFLNAKHSSSVLKNSLKYNIQKGLTNIFIYKNLPETIDSHLLELWIREYGAIVFFQTPTKELHFGIFNRKSWDRYGQPLKVEIYSPYNSNKFERTNTEDCIVMKNNTQALPTSAFIETYLSDLQDIWESLHHNRIVTRALRFWSTKDIKQMKVLERQMKSITTSGQTDIFISEKVKGMIDGMKALSEQFKNQQADLWNDFNNVLVQLYRHVGLPNDNVLKQSGMSNQELSQFGTNTVLSVQEEYRERKASIEKINKMFGTEIEIEISGIEELQEDKPNQMEQQTTSNSQDNMDDQEEEK